MREKINRLLKIMEKEGVFKTSKITDIQKKAIKKAVSLLDLGLYFYGSSLDSCEGKVYFLIEEGKERKLISCAPKEVNDEFEAERVLDVDGFKLKVCFLTHENAVAMRRGL